MHQRRYDREDRHKACDSPRFKWHARLDRKIAQRGHGNFPLKAQFDYENVWQRRSVPLSVFLPAHLFG